MVSAEQWLAALALAGVPAFHCRGSSGGIEIVARTPGFMAALQGLAGRLDERTLLSRLQSHTAQSGEIPVVIASDDAPGWRCVLHPVDGQPDEHLAILNLPAQWGTSDDAFLTIVENLPDVVTRYDREFRCRYANPAIGAITGVPAESRIGKTYTETGAAAALATSFEAAYQRVIDTGEPVEVEFDYEGPTGLRHYLGRAAPEFDRDGQVESILSVVRDISDVKRLQHQLEQLARTDPLTSLLNRRSFTARLGTELDRVQRGHGGFSLLLLDLNNFKFINDRFGHVAGDRVLETVARILTDETRSHDVAARLGGDEFCVALIDTDAAGAAETARRIAERVSAIVDDTGRTLGVSVSVGVAAAEAGDATALDLLARVDMLMYQAKLGGDP
ncbi:GGDEF domain-containing protein [Mycobacterium sp. shizuoka-1]|uniref:sensor domain-containing diguanylate cyclase n=1 Tax=Mycobacterium sp. shizuoka-1 TaxID=2039281 RepID=UPI000C065485|nr:GGDEF domain-containing protein [Mycobacterium sp. shizuoka-1]GAY18884.1 hypothetical protein MSZK_56100 [Mycobacterium sp. shizuoka-1]